MDVHLRKKQGIKEEQELLGKTKPGRLLDGTHSVKGKNVLKLVRNVLINTSSFAILYFV